jgi:hypothetical protein
LFLLLKELRVFPDLVFKHLDALYESSLFLFSLFIDVHYLLEQGVLFFF